MIRIDPKIANHVDAALAAGFTVYSLSQSYTDPRPAGFVAVCLTEDGPFAHIQKPTHSWDPVSLDVPIKPSKEYGSGVLIDYDGTPEGAVAALTVACTLPNVTVRFLKQKRGDWSPAPAVPNYGRKCIEGWPGGTEFVRLGKRGTNWEVKQPAVRLEPGDRFVFDAAIDGPGDVVTVESRRYTGPDYATTVVTATDGRTISLPPKTVVTLAGVA